MPEIDTANRFMVSAHGDKIHILLWPSLFEPITKTQALGLAAWLVAIADDNNEFKDILKAVENT